MKICVIGKYPPLQGGTSAQTFWFCRLLAERGHHVHVVTNATEVEPEYRTWFLPGDEEQLQGGGAAGGELTLTATRDWDAARYQHIPAGNPAASRLAAMATEVVREKGCDLIFAWYLEPYGIAANLAAAWTGRPFVIRYAGSDRSCLMSHPELGLAYKEVMRSAAGVLTMGEDLSGFGIPAERAVPAPGRYLPPAFSPQTRPLDLEAVMRELHAARCPQIRSTRPLDPGLPTIGVYGKVGTTKGTFDLLRAVALLRRRGTPVQLVIMGGGVTWPRVLEAIGDAGLDEVAWTLPFLAPWRVPGFIRACTAVCFLERDFTISQHTPAVAAEVLACGTALVVSREIAQKQPFASQLIDGNNHFLVTDPAASAALADVVAAAIEDPARAHRVGARGADVVRKADPGHGEGYEHAFGQCLTRFSRPPADQRRAAFLAEAESLLRARCPATVRLLAERLTAAIEAACGTLADPGGTALAAAYLLTRDLIQQAAREGARSADHQLASLEHHLLWLGIDVEGIDGQAAFAVPVTSGDGLAVMDRAAARALRPVASRHIRTARYSVDLSAHLPDLRMNDRAARQAPCAVSQTLLFHKRPDLAGTIYRISDSTRRVLGRCDGATSLAEIAAETGAGPDAWPRLVRLVEFLRTRDIMAFARYPAGAAGRPSPWPAGLGPAT